MLHAQFRARECLLSPLAACFVGGFACYLYTKAVSLCCHGFSLSLSSLVYSRDCGHRQQKRERCGSLGCRRWCRCVRDTCPSLQRTSSVPLVRIRYSYFFSMDSASFLRICISAVILSSEYLRCHLLNIPSISSALDLLWL